MLFSWSTNFTVLKDGDDLIIPWHTATDTYMVKLDAASKAKMEAVIATIKAWMNTQDTWSGTVTEHHQLQDVVKEAVTVKEWVKVL